MGPQITITDAAITKLRGVIDARGCAAVVRLGLRAGGCMGFEQFIDIGCHHRDDDVEFTYSNIAFLVDAKSAKILNGAALDWRSSLTESRFQFILSNNPASCSCGKSFAL